MLLTSLPHAGDSALLLSDRERAQPSSISSLEIQDDIIHPSEQRSRGRLWRCCGSMMLLQGVPCTIEIYGIGLGMTLRNCSQYAIATNVDISWVKVCKAEQCFAMQSTQCLGSWMCGGICR